MKPAGTTSERYNRKPNSIYGVPHHKKEPTSEHPDNYHGQTNVKAIGYRRCRSDTNKFPAVGNRSLFSRHLSLALP